MAAGDFRWNDWNCEHATGHGCTIPEIESVVRNRGRGFPRRIGDGKYLVQGRGVGGRRWKSFTFLMRIEQCMSFMPCRLQPDDDEAAETAEEYNEIEKATQERSGGRVNGRDL